MDDIELQRFESHYIPEPNSGCWLGIGEAITGANGNVVRFEATTWACHDLGGPLGCCSLCGFLKPVANFDRT